MRVLVVATHPDDEVLGAGVAILRHVRNGDEVQVCILTNGGTGRYDDTTIQRLRQSAKECAAALGVSKLHLFDFPNQTLYLERITAITSRLEEFIREFRPDVLYTHHQGDINLDHRMAFHAALTASRPVPDTCVPRVLSFEVPSSTDWGMPVDPAGFRPNYFVNAEGVIEDKIAAFLKYGTEVRPFPHPRSAEALRAYAQKWGVMAGLRAAEPFVLIRDIWR